MMNDLICGYTDDGTPLYLRDTEGSFTQYAQDAAGNWWWRMADPMGFFCDPWRRVIR